MYKKIYQGLSCVTICAVLAWPVRAQAQGAAAKPDSPGVQAQIDKAKKIAGTFWAPEEKFLCEESRTFDGRSTAAADPGPVKLFDNLYAIPGQYSVQSAVVFVIPTSAGIMLIDAGKRKDVESVVVPGLKTLGLDPANIKLIVVTHGHEDHYGGATYLQERYGAHVALSAVDWDFISKPPAAAGAAAPAVPKRDMVAVEGQPITLGDESVTPVSIPGHTPGSMGVIFPVKDQGKTHVVGIFGGGFIIWRQYNDQTGAQFVSSVQHFEEWTKKMKVDVELQNHPGTWDGFTEKLALLQARKPGQPNPFVVGQQNYTKFLEVMSICAQAALDRRKD
jgi:metallo-beta-lactamase class B